MEEQALFEHRFWLQILGDHSRFIFNALSPKEIDVHMAQAYIHRFDKLLEFSRQTDASIHLSQLNKQAYEATSDLREFKLSLLDRLLLGQVQIGMTPTFINHMVNELEEYSKILNALLAGNPVPHFSSLHHDLLWLPDAAGHAVSIAMDLDSVEKRLIHKSVQFEEHFNSFYLKAIELTGYMRTMRDVYPALSKFHLDVNMEMSIFMSFLKEIEELELSSELLSRLNPLMPDHMYREECYYLLKLSECGAIPAPNCNPDAPRIVIN
ncbi:hypothetical protein FHS16_000581 [Paenibacillus endophyticus]|uniref:DUF2935 domain-containing protein n=1 Tax=Paenibacillus endophyticus TaxID=1294268 RepID=A0A7W5C456_9BACL|nr:DUF2935 domain-containing protein [Paenibacillus endophyticus]MBB3150547.1 hypothetical protein [Paenibacillus endophyticus]